MTPAPTPLKTTVAELATRIPWPVDTPQAHARDELYIVVSGTGTFVCGAQRVAFAPHDALFVRAGVEHRFIDTGADFQTWVVYDTSERGESQELVQT